MADSPQGAWPNRAEDQPPVPVGITVTTEPTGTVAPVELTKATDPVVLICACTVVAVDVTAPSVMVVATAFVALSAVTPLVAKEAWQGLTTTCLPTARGCVAGNVLDDTVNTQEPNVNTPDAVCPPLATEKAGPETVAPPGAVAVAVVVATDKVVDAVVPNAGTPAGKVAGAAGAAAA